MFDMIGPEENAVLLNRGSSLLIHFVVSFILHM
jgi:hypothetical protein